MKINSTKKSLYWFILGLAFLKIVLPFFLQDSIYQPHRDELLYLSQGNHLDWGYMEVPPLLSLFSWMAIHFGSSIFWIKIWPAIFSALTYLLCAEMVMSLKGKFFALFLAWLPFVFGAYIRVYFLFQPNFLEVFFWTLMSFSLFKFIQTEKTNWIYLMGVALGFGLLSKYSIGFYFIALMVGGFIAGPRKVFLSRDFYLSLFLATLLFLPNLLWEYHHNFPFIFHMRTLENQQLQYISPRTFIINQFLMNLPGILIWLGGLFYLYTDPEMKKFRVFFWAYFLVLAILLLLRGKDYYALGAYPILMVFGSFYLERFLQNRIYFLRYALIAQIFILGIFLIPLLMPLYKPEKLSKFYIQSGLGKSGFCTWEDQKQHPLPQDFADMLGWKEMTEMTAKAYFSLNAEERKNTIIFCDDYCSAGALDYYKHVFKLPDSYSNNSSYLLWIPHSIQFKNILLVRRSGLRPDDDIRSGFEKIILMDSLKVPMAREKGMKVLLLQHAKPEFIKYLAKKLSIEKSAFQIF